MNKPVTDIALQRTAATLIRKYHPVQLAFWPDKRRAIPNELARCSLFHCRQSRKPRNHYDNHELYSLGDAKVTYTGEELRSLDEDVFLALAHAARSMPSDDMVIKISNRQICDLTNRHHSQVYYTEIYKSIQRMRGGIITVFSARLTKALACEKALEEGAAPEVLERLYADLADFDRRQELNLLTEKDTVSGVMMTLIDSDPEFTGGKRGSGPIPKGNLEWTIKLNRRLVTLFAKSYLTLVDFEVRKHLSPGARRLQAYFGSHRKPIDVHASSLARMLALELEDKAIGRAIQGYLDELVKEGVLLEGKVIKAVKEGEKNVHVVRPMRDDEASAKNDTLPA